MAKKNEEFSQEQLSQLLRQPEAQALLARLRQMDPAALQQAVSKAMNGELEQAKQTLEPMLQDPKIQELTRQIGESDGGI